MKYSTLTEIPVSRGVTEAFGGYNHNLRISDGEFYDMKNLTSSHYPLLAPRDKRGAYTYPQNLAGSHRTNGIIAKDALCYVDENKLYINNKEIVGLMLTDSPKQLISMGAYLIIMPDKKWVNTTDFSYGNIEAKFNSEGETISATYEMCKVDGEVYTDTEQGYNPPEDTSKLWIDISTTPHALKQYSTSNEVWSQIATTYIKIKATNIAMSFKQYDAVMITGLPTDAAFKDLEGKVSPLWAVHHDEGEEGGRAEGTDDYIVVVGFLDTVINGAKTSLKLERTMPKMDFVIESGNRLWGCRYGTNAGGEVVNEIYASKLGDFKNWFCYMGLSTD